MLEETSLSYAFISVYANELRSLAAFPDAEQHGAAALSTACMMSREIGEMTVEACI